MFSQRFRPNPKASMPCGSEVSALLGRMPSAVGYQPTLSTEMFIFRIGFIPIFEIGPKTTGNISRGVANGSAGSPIIDGSRTAKRWLESLLFPIQFLHHREPQLDSGVLFILVMDRSPRFGSISSDNCPMKTSMGKENGAPNLESINQSNSGRLRAVLLSELNCRIQALARIEWTPIIFVYHGYSPKCVEAQQLTVLSRYALFGRRTCYSIEEIFGTPLTEKEKIFYPVSTLDQEQVTKTSLLKAKESGGKGGRAPRSWFSCSWNLDSLSVGSLAKWEAHFFLLVSVTLEVSSLLKKGAAKKCKEKSEHEEIEEIEAEVGETETTTELPS
ncbi:ATP synthase subunit beta [Striga asiatica]|uniref:ATP synthase subunit beta n=1 Tax=Striga asiatica TaxID=4170 RepID=A0A5A7PL30_STRAF|nr:ATP synthase subunit beta [Striga asiatica]